MMQGPQETTALRMREALKMSQGCHNCNQTNQHPQEIHPAVLFLQMPLMKGKYFRVGQVNRSKHPGPQGSVVHAFRGGPRGHKGNAVPHIK
jgi:hypothetical protein